MARECPNNDGGSYKRQRRDDGGSVRRAPDDSGFAARGDAWGAASPGDNNSGNAWGAANNDNNNTSRAGDQALGKENASGEHAWGSSNNA